VSKFKEYKVIYIVEGACGTLLLGSSGLPIKKLEAILNEEAAQGWEVVFQIIEQKRMLLFWQREAIVMTLGRA
jgi:hypothetical protein